MIILKDQLLKKTVDDMMNGINLNKYWLKRNLHLLHMKKQTITINELWRRLYKKDN